MCFTKLATQLQHIAREWERKKNVQKRQVRVALGLGNTSLNANAMQIDQAHFLRLLVDQNISRMQVAVHDTFGVHCFDELEDLVAGNASRLIEWFARKAFSDQDALVEARDGPTFAQGQMMHDRNSQGFQLLREFPLLSGLRFFEEELERPQRTSFAAIPLYEKDSFGKRMRGDNLGRRYLDDLASTIQNALQQWREFIAKLPAHSVFLAANHGSP